ncbi:TolB family protein [Actinoallomurus sp. CA-150999]|uniref:TolB family protein n=1 Tax=Actinoallomurus sp. CA-150999 TaxID=3239887 RepID=UPI003D93A4B3
MTEIENRLRDAYEAATSTVRPEALRPLTAPPARRAKPLWAIPVAVAAAVALIVAGAVLLGNEEQKYRTDPAAAAGAPAYAVALVDKGEDIPSRAVVLSTATGRQVAAIPGAYLFGSVAAAGDRRTFFLTAKEGDCATRVYRVRVRGDGSVTAPVALPGAPVPADGGMGQDLAASPDGRRVAFGGDCGDLGRLVVVDTETGQQRVWTSQTGDPADRGVKQPTWAPDGRTIGFRYHAPPNGELRLLDTDHAPAGDLLAASRVLRPQDMTKNLRNGRFEDGQIESFVFNPDGSLTAVVQRTNHSSGDDQFGLVRLTAAGVPTGRADWFPSSALGFYVRVDSSGEHFLSGEGGRIPRVDNGRFSWLHRSSKPYYYDVAW